MAEVAALVAMFNPGGSISQIRENWRQIQSSGPKPYRESSDPQVESDRTVRGQNRRKYSFAEYFRRVLSAEVNEF
jgi:hypothetical protein